MADAQDSGSCGRPYGFKSLRPHQKQRSALTADRCFSVPDTRRDLRVETRAGASGLRTERGTRQDVTQTEQRSALFVGARRQRRKSLRPHQKRSMKMIQKYRLNTSFLLPFWAFRGCFPEKPPLTAIRLLAERFFLFPSANAIVKLKGCR